MALDFPASPSNGQIFSSGGISWTFDGEKWKISSSGIEPVFISSSTPTGVAGQIYWDSDESTAYIYYDDGNTAQWVPLVSTAPVSFDTSAIVSGTLPVARGGTGGTLPVENGGTGITVYGSAGQVLTSNGSNNNPSWQDASGGGSYDFVASGAIANGDVVIINTDGTVSVVTGAATGGPSAATPVAYESASSAYHSVAYDAASGKVVFVYKDAGNSSYGTAVVGTVSGESISFGTPVVFASTNLAYTGITYDSTNEKVVIIYEDVTNNQYGTGIVGTVSGTSISFGTAAVFESVNVSWLDIEYDPDSGKVIAVYRDNTNTKGKAVVGTVSGTGIAWGTPVTFNNAITHYPRIAYDSNNQKAVIAFEDDADNDYGKAVVGTVSGTTISFGSEVTFSGTNAVEHVDVTYDSSNQKVVIVYKDAGNSLYGTAVVGTVSGNSISFGTPVVYNTGNSQYNRAIYDASRQKVVIVYEDVGSNEWGTAIVGTVSGTSISFGTAVVWENSRTQFIGAAYDSGNQKVVIGYEDAGDNDYGKAVVFSASTSSTTLTTENYIGIAAEAIADAATGKINIIGGVNEGQTGLTAGQTYYVQGDGSLGLSADFPNVVAGTAISSTKIIVKG